MAKLEHHWSTFKTTILTMLINWFLKADDDNYAIIENLRFYQSKFNTSEPRYLGRIFTHAGAYNSGVGYVFSRETLRKLQRALGEPIAAHNITFLRTSVSVS